jgi:hypothetical protein
MYAYFGDRIIAHVRVLLSLEFLRLTVVGNHK